MDSSPSYIYCDNEEHFNQFWQHFTSLEISTPDFHVILDCEGRALGRMGGNLGLVQLGIDNVVYLIDVVSLPKSLDNLKLLLENPQILKIVWDGRSDYTELRLGHDISLRGVLDLQLVQVYVSSSGLVASGEHLVKLESLGNAFTNLSHDVVRRSGICTQRLLKGSLNQLDLC